MSISSSFRNKLCFLGPSKSFLEEGFLYREFCDVGLGGKFSHDFSLRIEFLVVTFYPYGSSRVAFYPELEDAGFNRLLWLVVDSDAPTLKFVLFVLTFRMSPLLLLRTIFFTGAIGLHWSMRS